MIDNATGIKAMLLRVLQLCPDGRRHAWNYHMTGTSGWKTCGRCGTREDLVLDE